MRVKYQFVIDPMEFAAILDSDRAKYFEYQKRNGIKHICELISDRVELEQDDFEEPKYMIDLLVAPTSLYLSLKNEIRTLLIGKLDSETFAKVGQLFKQLEI